MLSLLVVQTDSARKLSHGAGLRGISFLRECATVDQALEALRNGAGPDALLVEESLAREPGVVARLENAAMAPVLLLVDRVGGDTHQQARKAGAFGVVPRPVDTHLLEASIRIAMDQFRRREELVQRRDVLDGLLHASREGFFILDDQGNFLEANDAYSELVEYTREELRGMNGADVEADEDIAQIRHNLRKIMEEGTMDLIRRHRAKSGRLVDVELTCSARESERGWRFLVFCRDITERLAREKRLRLQTNALAAAANAVVITAADGRIEWVNKAFTNITGFRPEEAIGRQPGEVLKSDRHPPEFYREMWETIRRGDVWRGEIVNKNKRGECYEEEMTITPIYDSQGVITHYIAIKQDISERKRLERMFHRAQRLESIGTLSSGVAHDLNNVLSPIIMSSELLLMKDLDPETRELMEAIRDGGKRGADIIRQLLSFARGTEGVHAEVQLRHLLKELTKVLRETFPKNIRVVGDLEAGLAPVRGDATQLHQVVTNLAINARDAMPEGGELLVEARNVTLSEADPDRPEDLPPGEYVQVGIQDEGTGIPEAIREKIFEPFFTTKETGRGTGLGLATSRDILQSHHGAIRLTTEVGRGTRFDLLLPVAGASARRDDLPEAAGLPQGEGQRILVTDDEEAVRFMLKGALSSLGYQVDLARDGMEALERLESAHPPFDLLLLDAMMPRMDGYQLIRALEDRDVSPDVLLMSGMLDDAKWRGLGLDPDTSFLPKPFTIAELARKISDRLASVSIARKAVE